MADIFSYVVVFLISMAPLIETRGSIIFGVGAGLNPYAVLILSIIGNMLIMPAIFKLLRHAHLRQWLFRIFRKHAEKHIARHSKNIELYRELALIIFVSVPIPITGPYLAAFISELLGWKWKKSMFAIWIGIVITSIITLLGAEGVIQLVKLF